jgi:DNA-binding NarL/FixJ family response regulator
VTALSGREAQLAELAAQGLSNAEIAERPVLSVRTVETYHYQAMQKLGLSDREELARVVSPAPASQKITS